MKNVELDDASYDLLIFLSRQLNLEPSDILKFSLNMLDRVASDTCIFVDNTLYRLFIGDRDYDALSTTVNLGSFFYKEVLEEVFKDLGFEFPPLIEDIDYSSSPYHLFIYATVNKYVDSREFDVSFLSFIYEEDYELGSVELTYFFEEDVGSKLLKGLEERFEDFRDEIVERVIYSDVNYYYEEYDRSLGGGYSLILSLDGFEYRPNLFTVDEILKEFIRSL